MTIRKIVTVRAFLLEMFAQGATKEEVLSGQARCTTRANVGSEIRDVNMRVKRPSASMPYVLYVEIYDVNATEDDEPLMNEEARPLEVEEAYATFTKKWRLPTLAEASAIYRGMIEENFLALKDIVWTSDPYRGRDDAAWVMSMSLGLLTAGGVDEEHFVLPVRSTYEKDVIEVAPIAFEATTWRDSFSYADCLALEQNNVIQLEYSGTSFKLRKEELCQH